MKLRNFLKSLPVACGAFVGFRLPAKPLTNILEDLVKIERVVNNYIFGPLDKVAASVAADLGLPPGDVTVYPAEAEFELPPRIVICFGQYHCVGFDFVGETLELNWFGTGKW